MGEIRFYQLRTRPLERVLPVMLERCLDRGWRAVVQGTDPERLTALDLALWTYRDESFLPHGLAGRAPGRAEEHPIWLTAATERPAGARALFLIDRAEAGLEPSGLVGLETVAILFDGTDEAALAAARTAWRATVAAGLRAVYWAEEAGGGWARTAESGGAPSGGE